MFEVLRGHGSDISGWRKLLRLPRGRLVVLVLKGQIGICWAERLTRGASEQRDPGG